MSVQDNLVQSNVNNYFFNNRADYEAHKNEIVNNSTIFIDSDTTSESPQIEGLPLGFIFSSVLPQSNLNYHLLNGDSLLIADYGDFYTVLTTLISQNWSLSCTANEYAEDIAKTGNCGKFVINTTDSDVTGTYGSTTITVLANSFKIPTITKFIQGLSSITNLGESLEAGLPNITGSFNQSDCQVGTYNASASGAMYMTNQSRSYMYYRANGSENKGDLAFDASRSNSVYGKSGTVQPATTKYPYYMVVKNNNSTGLISYLNNLAQAGVQSIGGSVGAITVGSGLKIVNNELSVKTQVLWTNQNPTSEFSAQNITLSSSDYDYLIINYSNSTQSAMIAKGKGCQLIYVGLGWLSYDKDSIIYTQRNASYVDDTTYSITDASQTFWVASRNYQTLTRNNYCKPTEIIGIKL